MSKLIDMIGHSFNGCIVEERSGTSADRKAMWKCCCFCGEDFIATGKSIRDGSVKSCGCYRKKVLGAQGRLNKTHGETGSRLYNIWRGVKKRCNVPSDTSYKYYGEKGISVCKEWEESYETFRDWALSNGYKEDLTIDRIDPLKDYTPANCRWASYLEQGRNRTNNVRVIYNGRDMTLSEIAETLGESREMIWYRHKKGIEFDAPKRI